MNTLDQLLVIVEKEIKSKEIMMEKERQLPNNSFYYAGGHSALLYVRHIIENLITEEDESQVTD